MPCYLLLKCLYARDTLVALILSGRCATGPGQEGSLPVGLRYSLESHLPHASKPARVG